MRKLKLYGDRNLLFWALCLFACQPSGAQFGNKAAPELNGGGNWPNLTRPLTLKDLRGKVVLLDFWTDSCVNCIHTVPKIKELESKYGQALVVIGIHSPKYDMEKSDEVVKAAILKLGMKNPVLNDPQMTIWHRYNVQYWPTFVLIDQSGAVVGQISGDKQLERLDQAIGKIVAEAKRAGKLDEKSQRFKFVNEQSKRLSFPEKIIASEKLERLYLSDCGQQQILILAPDGRLIETVGAGIAGRKDGSFREAQFNDPHGLALVGDKLYVADTGNNLIRAVDLSKQTVTTVAGAGGKAPPSTSAGKALSLHLDAPQDICVLGDHLYIAMSGVHQIWRLNLSTSVAEPVAGTSTEGLRDGPARQALLAQPTGITTDGAKVYFIDSESSSLRMFDPAENVVRTLIGKGLFDFGDIDGSPVSARLQHPLAVLSWKNKLFVSDTLNNKIKTFDQSAIKTLAGSHQPGRRDGNQAQFSSPDGLASLHGKLYVADTNNHCIRVIDLTSGVTSTLAIAKREGHEP